MNFLNPRKVKRAVKLFLFNSKAFSKLMRRNHLLVIGDSHVNVFKYLKQSHLLPKSVWIDYLTVGGATAQGVLNPGSKTDARRLFLERVNSAKKFQHLLVQLGEVDCGFVIWYYSEKLGSSVDAQLFRSSENYSTFLKELKSLGFNTVSVLSAPLPTIRDGQDWGDIAKKRSEVTAKQTDRTELTVRFNREMLAVCASQGINYIDHTSIMLNESTGIVRDEYLHHDKNDHHLNDETYAELIANSLETMFGKNR